ncbi:MAG: DUF2298 domain-containing protein [Anaerolineales bacterium]
MMDQLLAAVLWYLLVAALGWLSFPIAYRFLGALPDRGYAFSRPLGMLLWGFIFWLLSSFGFLHNDVTGLLTAAALLGGLSWWAWKHAPKGELRAWLRTHVSTVVVMEAVFLLAFLFMAFIRTARPEIFHTEQPMELAFINGILRSPSMPPHDPWLSGYSISYYYFGYLMIAMLAKLAGVIGSVAFNLGFITTFASAALAAYGLAYNLLVLYRPKARAAMLWFAGLAPLFVLLLGNVEGLLEIAHSQHLFWPTDANGAQSSTFWAWLDIDDLSQPPPNPEPQWAPRNYASGAWWWWRASRVINDRAFNGGDQELIDEIPAFSFTLGDLHPHVLSMPFVMLAMGLALNVYLGGAERKDPLPLVVLRLRGDALLLAMVILGGLAFLNIWDFPIYVGLFALAYMLRYIHQEGWSWMRAVDLVSLVIILIIGGILVYLPFYLGFTSQAAGILPNVINPTRGVHLWVLFGLLVLPLFIFLIKLWRGTDRWRAPLLNIVWGLLFVAGLWIASFLLAGIYATIMASSELGQALASLGAPDLAGLLAESVRRRWTAAGGLITLAALLGLAFGLLIRPAAAKHQRKAQPGIQQSRAFLILLVFMGALLVAAPEFIYLRDQFGTRMNTVFKFFFQAWQMWAVAAAVASTMLLQELRGLGRALFGGLLVLLLGVGALYPMFSFSDITRNPVGSLDGASYISSDVRSAIAWLQQAPLGPLVEAIGGQYDASFARYATHSGQPALMGWPGHEGQWRGGNVDWARIGDVQTLYNTPDWQVAAQIIDHYDVRYIVVGSVERSSYAVNEAKFAEHLEVAFQNEGVTIYQVP